MTKRTLLGIALATILVIAIASSAFAQVTPPNPAADPGEPAPAVVTDGNNTIERLPAGNLRPGIYAARDWRYLHADSRKNLTFGTSLTHGRILLWLLPDCMHLPDVIQLRFDLVVELHRI